jgi:hypothetical protein
MAKFSYMPMPACPGNSHPFMVLMANLPMHHLYPDATNGNWADVNKHPEAVLALNGFLWMIEAAHNADTTVYIEEVIDYDLFGALPTVKVTHCLRLFIPLTSVEASVIIMQAACMLTPVVNREQTGASKKAGSPGAMSPAPKYGVTNTIITHEAVFCQATFLRYVATMRGAMASDTLTFMMPDDPDDDNQLDDDDDAAVPSYHDLDPTNFLSMMSIEKQWSNLIDMGTGIHPDQLDMAAYWTTGTFKFPDVSKENSLVHTIGPRAPWLDGSADGLLTCGLPGATHNITKEELRVKILFLRGVSRGGQIDLSTADLPGLREELFKLGANGAAGGDPTIHSPIIMQEGITTKSCAHLCDSSEQLLAKMYPRDYKIRANMTTQFIAIGRGWRDGVVSTATFNNWLAGLEECIHNIYSTPPQEGVPRIYPLVYQDATNVIASIAKGVADEDPIAINAMAIVHNKGDPKMTQHMQILCRFSDLTRNVFHQTPPQSAFVMFAYVVSMTTYIPHILEAQPWIILLGGSDTGKSACMSLLGSLVMRSAVGREDSQSKMVVTENGPHQIQINDELKCGTKDSDKAASTMGLTSKSEGQHTHCRLVAPMKAGDKYVNVTTTSDQRGFFISASNDTMRLNVASRAIIMYLTGVYPEDARSRAEMATVNDNNGPHKSATLAMQLVWAWHFRFWCYYSVIRFQLVKAWFPVFYALAKQVLGRSYDPAPRDVKLVGKIGIGIMVNRITIAYETGPKDVTFLQHILASPIVWLTDYCNALGQMCKNTAMAKEDAAVLCTLKACVMYTPRTGPGPDELMVDSADYYVTSLKTDGEVAARTVQIGSSAGVISHTMERLRAQSIGGNCTVVNVTSGKFKDHIAVLIQQVCNNKVRIAGEVAIINFFKQDVIPAADKLWRVGFDERWVVCTELVKNRILEPHSNPTFMHSAALSTTSISQKMLDLGMIFMEAAGEIRYRDIVDGSYPDYTINTEAAAVSTYVTPHTVPVDRGGMLDERRVWPDFHDVVDSEIDDAFAQSQMDQLEQRAGVPVTTPCDRRWKSATSVMNAISIQARLVEPELNEELCKSLGVVCKMTTFDFGDTVDRDEKLAELWNVCAAVSGEYQPGDKVFNGIDTKSNKTFEVLTIKPVPGSVLVLNARRQSIQTNYGEAVADDEGDTHDIENWLLPIGEDRVRFACTDSTKTDDMSHRTRILNFCENA